MNRKPQATDLAAELLRYALSGTGNADGEHRGMSMGELASALGVSDQYIRERIINPLARIGRLGVGFRASKNVLGHPRKTPVYWDKGADGDAKESKPDRSQDRRGRVDRAAAKAKRRARRVLPRPPRHRD